MKKLILLELTLLFLATTFQSDNPPGWYQQQLPVNDFVNDIFFLDSLNGWVVTDHQGGSDTSYIMRTTNGGDNWEINYKTFVQFTAIQFVNSNTGYACGIGPGPELFKSTNGGSNWLILNVLTFTWKSDLYFINKDTGWVCSTDPFDGGLFKTTDGGISWQRQLDQTYEPSKVFYINYDTGWIITSSTNKLYMTTNSGINWNFQFSFQPTLRNLFFVNKDTGWIIRNNTGTNGILKTTNGGFNWLNQIDPDPTGSGLADLFFINNQVGYIATAFSKIIKTNNGETWGKQNAPTGSYSTIFLTDSLVGWSGGNSTGIPIFIHTEDGGGPIVNIKQSTSEIKLKYKLYQNYPNPFNPKTIISYELRVTSYVKLKVFDIQGKEISILVNTKQREGEYKANFDGSGLNSGVYFYTLEVYDGKTNHIYSETKKMLLIR